MPFGGDIKMRKCQDPQLPTASSLLALGEMLKLASLRPNKRKAEKTDFGDFEAFFHLYAPQKQHFVRYCGVFAELQNFEKRCRKTRKNCVNNVSKTPQAVVP